MATYAVSDLHGNYDLFLQGLKKINFSDNDVLYVVGDVVDKGPDSIPLLLHIMNTENMDMVLGNHEFMMLNSVNLEGKNFCKGKDTMLWLYSNHGDKTFEEYKKLPEETRTKLIDWLLSRKLSTELTIDTGKGNINIILTHSCYDPEFLDVEYSKISYWDAWNIVWKSMFRADVFCPETTYTDHPDKVFITGHVPVQRMRKSTGDLKPYRSGNLLNIDGGLAYGDAVPGNGAIFVRLEDQKVFPVLRM